MPEALAAEVQELRDTVERRGESLHEIRNEMQEMKLQVRKIECDTRELLEIFHSLKGGFRVLGWLGLFAKWVGGVAGAVYGAWQLYLKYTGR